MNINKLISCFFHIFIFVITLCSDLPNGTIKPKWMNSLKIQSQKLHVYIWCTRQNPLRFHIEPFLLFINFLLISGWNKSRTCIEMESVCLWTIKTLSSSLFPWRRSWHTNHSSFRSTGDENCVWTIHISRRNIQLKTHAPLFTYINTGKITRPETLQ